MLIIEKLNMGMKIACLQIVQYLYHAYWYWYNVAQIVIAVGLQFQVSLQKYLTKASKSKIRILRDLGNFYSQIWRMSCELGLYVNDILLFMIHAAL